MTGDMVTALLALSESPLVRFLLAVPLLAVLGAVGLVLVDTIRRAAR